MQKTGDSHTDRIRFVRDVQLVGCGLAILVFWLYYTFFVSDFQRALPWGKRVALLEYTFDRGDYFYHARASISPSEFEKLKTRFSLEAFRPNMLDSQFYYMPTFPDLEMDLVPSWFTPSTNLLTAFMFQKHPYFTIAAYEDGTVFLFQRYSNWHL